MIKFFNAFWPVDMKFGLPVEQHKSRDKTNESEEMISVKMRDENMLDLAEFDLLPP